MKPKFDVVKTTLAIADDYRLVAQALASTVQKFEEYDLLFVVENGRQLIDRIQAGTVPDIVLLDIGMPVMDGYEAAAWLRANSPGIKVLIVSIRDREEDMVRAIREGVRGYLRKDECKPAQLRQALDDIRDQGFYYSDFLHEPLVRGLRPDEPGLPETPYPLDVSETNFIRWACTDLTYAKIADRMGVSPQVLDGYRESVFQKLGVKNRVSLALKAVRLGLLEL